MSNKSNNCKNKSVTTWQSNKTLSKCLTSLLLVSNKSLINLLSNKRILYSGECFLSPKKFSQSGDHSWGREFDRIEQWWRSKWKPRRKAVSSLKSGLHVFSFHHLVNMIKNDTLLLVMVGGSKEPKAEVENTHFKTSLLICTGYIVSDTFPRGGINTALIMSYVLHYCWRIRILTDMFHTNL